MRVTKEALHGNIATFHSARIFIEGRWLIELVPAFLMRANFIWIVSTVFSFVFFACDHVDIMLAKEAVAR